MVTDTVVNLGDGLASSSMVRYYLSVNAMFDTNDRSIGTRSVWPLGPSASNTGSANVTIPSTLPTGTYALLACADDGNIIVERNEANNCRPAGNWIVVN